MLYDCLLAGFDCWETRVVGGYVTYCLCGWCCMLVGCFVYLICCVVVLDGCHVNCVWLLGCCLLGAGVLFSIIVLF